MFFSIIVPVLNEEAELEAHLAHLCHIIALHSHHTYEVIIIDGGSCDGTVAIAQQYGRVLTSSRGRARQMNTGASAARGDIFLFLHADTTLPVDAFDTIERAFQSPEVVGGAFRVCFNCARWPYRFVAFTTNLRSRIRMLFTGDQAYFIRATRFREIGGYPEQPLMEDLEIIARLRTTGKIVLLPQYVTTSARRHEHIGLLRSVLFMWYLRTLYTLGVPAARLQQMYLDVR